MSTIENQENKKNTKPENSDQHISNGRREALKTLATVPVLGAMAYGVYKKTKRERSNRFVSEMFHFQENPEPAKISDGDVIRLGIIGIGIRGFDLMQAIGFTTPEKVQELKDAAKRNSKDTR